MGKLRRLLRVVVPRGLQAVFAVAATAALASPPVAAPADAPQAVPSAAVAAQGGSGSTAYEGVVEAMRQTIMAAQVSGAVVALQVRVGDKVHAGQVLMRIDARAADQTAAAGAAQARAARAATEEATREFERQRQLFVQGYISQAALDRADAHFKTAQAQASAQLANAAAARTQSDFYIVKAPYGGVVANVSVVLGEMAMPGRPLLTLYDPTALRVTAAIPQTAVAELAGPLAPQVEIPGAAAGLVKPVHVQLLPTVDAASHTLELRLDLPANTNAAPGMFARAWLSGPDTGGTRDARLFVPSQALVRRSEFAAVYVIGRDGRPMLRQVRPGRSDGSQVEILSGVAAGERVALDPQAAARIR
ncbi:efflux RND transporter periplasmic adaptor subunit [Piscinibacter sp.]|uniref:efflux RND transporter periplasmic adaptor subunit n=1 Tax=Piscinibacter sp. TaxID=1903157 RepID=UPI003559A3F1